jgi:hypothetical protein
MDAPPPTDTLDALRSGSRLPPATYEFHWAVFVDANRDSLNASGHYSGRGRGRDLVVVQSQSLAKTLAQDYAVVGALLVPIAAVYIALGVENWLMVLLIVLLTTMALDGLWRAWHA